MCTWGERTRQVGHVGVGEVIVAATVVVFALDRDNIHGRQGRATRPCDGNGARRGHRVTERRRCSAWCPRHTNATHHRPATSAQRVSGPRGATLPVAHPPPPHPGCPPQRGRRQDPARARARTADLGLAVQLHRRVVHAARAVQARGHAANIVASIHTHVVRGVLDQFRQDGNRFVEDGTCAAGSIANRDDDPSRAGRRRLARTQPRGSALRAGAPPASATVIRHVRARPWR